MKARHLIIGLALLFVVSGVVVAVKLSGRLKPSGAATAARPETGTARFQGRVVDDATGQPVNDYALEGGATYLQNPDEIVWGFGRTYSSGRRNGAFQEESGGQVGKKIWLRVVADGYLPEPVSPKPAVIPARLTNLIVRLKRGSELRGVVMNHAGRPVHGARVFLASHQPLDLRDGQPELFKGSTAVTDAGGRFALRGAGGTTNAERVAVSVEEMQVWMAIQPGPGAAVNIQLPEPATLVVRYDIGGDQPEAQLRLELKTWEMPEWKEITAVVEPKVANRGQIALTNLAPGSYDLGRQKTVKAGDIGSGVFCDRQTVILEAGKTQRVDFVRTTGSPIRGEVVGLKDLNVSGALIYVRSAEATGFSEKQDEWELPIYDALACDAEGQFQTALLEPGDYTIVVEAFKPETPEERGRTGWRLPHYIGTTKVTVRADAAPEPLKIELKPRGERGRYAN